MSSSFTSSVAFCNGLLNLYLPIDDALQYRYTLNSFDPSTELHASQRFLLQANNTYAACLHKFELNYGVSTVNTMYRQGAFHNVR